jgi:hypothetical protein
MATKQITQNLFKKIVDQATHQVFDIISVFQFFTNSFYSLPLILLNLLQFHI